MFIADVSVFSLLTLSRYLRTKNSKCSKLTSENSNIQQKWHYTGVY